MLPNLLLLLSRAEYLPQSHVLEHRHVLPCVSATKFRTHTKQHNYSSVCKTNLTRNKCRLHTLPTLPHVSAHHTCHHHSLHSCYNKAFKRSSA